MSDPLDAVLRLVRAQAALVRRFASRLSGLHGVSLADFTLLLRLSQAPGGRMRRVDLAEALGMTASGVTRGLAPLERIGLVTREPDARDARVAYASLTATGHAATAGDDRHGRGDRHRDLHRPSMERRDHRPAVDPAHASRRHRPDRRLTLGRH